MGAEIGELDWEDDYATQYANEALAEVVRLRKVIAESLPTLANSGNLYDPETNVVYGSLLYSGIIRRLRNVADGVEEEYTSPHFDLERNKK